MMLYQGPIDDPLVRALAKASLAMAADEATGHVVKRSFVDAIGVVLAGSAHPLWRENLARWREWEQAFGAPGEPSATVWGVPGAVVSPVTAMLINASRLRCYDYNDLYFGPSRGVHPSDVIPALTAAAESAGADGRRLLESIEVGFQVQAILCDHFPSSSKAWDYTTLTAIGAVCGLGRLLELTETRLQHAISIVITMGVPPSEMESGARNRAGLLTGWKRFNAAWAGVKAYQAVTLVRLGVEGPYNPMTGSRSGLLDAFGLGPADVGALLGRLQAVDRWTAPAVSHKRWPTGSRAQACVQATLEALRPGREAGLEPVKVTAEVPPEVYRHMVRHDAYQPLSIDGADHSLPLLIAAAVVDGQVTAASYDDEACARPEIVRVLREVVFVEPSPSIVADEGPDYGAAVTVRWSDGSATSARVPNLPGLGATAFSDTELEAKARELAAAQGATAWADGVLPALWKLQDVSDLREMLRRTADA